MISCLQFIDTTDYKEMEYYKEWKGQIENNSFKSVKPQKEKLQVGYSKVNFTPDEPYPMAGYGKRKGEKYHSVHDSIYVRTIALKTGTTESFILSLDLLIVPPPVTERIKSAAEEMGIPFEQIYLGATHSHNSLGGWYNTLVGELFAGPYDPKVEKWIADKAIESLLKAQNNYFNASIKYEEDIDSSDVFNRVLNNETDIDPEIRSIVFKGEKDSLVLTTYSAHSTVLSSKDMELSRDYPGIVVDSLEASGYHFAMFMAGAVGSMGPTIRDKKSFEEAKVHGAFVTQEWLSTNEKESAPMDSASIVGQTFNLPLRVPSPRITQKLAMRPWLFYKLFGDYPAFVKIKKVGNILMIGLPCDFSGELMEELDTYASTKGMNLIVTSFNGAYAGYITDDRHFGTDHYETITMSWFGPHNGAYFSEVIVDIINQVAD